MHSLAEVCEISAVFHALAKRHTTCDKVLHVRTAHVHDLFNSMLAAGYALIIFGILLLACHYPAFESSNICIPCNVQLETQTGAFRLGSTSDGWF